MLVAIHVRYSDSLDSEVYVTDTAHPLMTVALKNKLLNTIFYGTITLTAAEQDLISECDPNLQCGPVTLANIVSSTV